MEKIFASHISDKELISKNIQRTHTTQQQQNNPIKMDKGPEQTFFQRRYTKSQQVYEKMLNIASH